MSHWYNNEAKLIDGATVREARKFNLYPSVTTVLDQLKKDGLDIWKINQAIMAAITLPRPQGTSDDEFMKLIKEDAKAQSIKAAEWGTQFHKLVLRVNDDIGDLNAYDNFTKIQFKHFKTWHNANVKRSIFSEYTSVNEQIGYAGTIDKVFEHMDGKNILADFKTKETKPDVKIQPYKEWCWQLAAYKGLQPCLPFDEYWNVVISSTEAGRIEVKKWTQDEIKQGEQIFILLLQLFKTINKLKEAA